MGGSYSLNKYMFRECILGALTQLNFWLKIWLSLRGKPEAVVSWSIHCVPFNIYFFKVSNKNARKRYEICSKLTLKRLERGH